MNRRGLFKLLLGVLGLMGTTKTITAKNKESKDLERFYFIAVENNTGQILSVVSVLRKYQNRPDIWAKVMDHLNYEAGLDGRPYKVKGFFSQSQVDHVRKNPNCYRLLTIDEMVERYGVKPVKNA